MLPAFTDLGPALQALISGPPTGWGKGWYRNLAPSVLAADLAGFDRLCDGGYRATSADLADVAEVEDWLAEAHD